MPGHLPGDIIHTGLASMIRPPRSRTCTATGIRLSNLVTAAAIVPLVLACGGDQSAGDREPDQTPGQGAPVMTGAPSELFLTHLAVHCGQAFSGGLTLEPPGDDMLTGTEELIVHFRECGADSLRIPFHIEVEATGEWDRSRTWILTRAPGDRLELRHDHREPDGRPSERTMYGGFSETPGTGSRQDFVSVERTEESGYPRGWRIEIVPGERYTYGTTRRGEWSWRIDFDLSRPVDLPPAPWGHGEGPG
jgi:hypothetical protein